ncbi:murein DD-endopeptidase MepM/ murein hydrolase activator NlpD [Hasllibacter halocynthiae]|uniref:Murein DD-endopeptidase MepM/ murein hydrolase activator NlpD n=1 Tax=Hasllibacter halocynthiae TaxID=595589 RepID=A0A2T0X800_9RHOB|nr:M23 family metallopeptidase [Hasllibacter halocynthiae]PRY95080.1 murein DD-endopeptidase MepM/ murein hydrolase activator NlpD [Hasllibacter halocynthiae]
MIRPILAATTILAIAACDQVDFDFRNTGPTAGVTRAATEPRPQADGRGIISYPGYQVAEARAGDTPAAVARRLGIDAAELARFNALPADVPLRRGEILALPSRVAEPSPATGAATTGPITPATSIEVTTLAGAAIDRAEAGRPAIAAPQQPAVSGREPIRHRVERGETAYTIARLYGISVGALAEWNGLGPDLAVQEGRFLLIPVRRENDTLRPARADRTTAPGAGSLTPEPPSASAPLPAAPPAPAAAPDPGERSTIPPRAEVEEPDLAQERTEASAGGRLRAPIAGSVIRPFAPGTNDGVDFGAAAGTPVTAAAAGTVAAITEDTSGAPILVLRHGGNLLTVYANIGDLAVSRGESVSAGQRIAAVKADGDFLHFEVREGFEARDPVDYLN